MFKVNLLTGMVSWTVLTCYETLPWSSLQKCLSEFLTYFLDRPGPKVIKLFSSPLTKTPNKQESFTLASLSSLVYCLRVRLEEPTRVTHILGHTRKYYTRLARPARDKHSSLFGSFIIYEEKHFITLASQESIFE
jgi:hypothetical protein